MAEATGERRGRGGFGRGRGERRGRGARGGDGGDKGKFLFLLEIFSFIKRL